MRLPVEGTVLRTPGLRPPSPHQGTSRDLVPDGVGASPNSIGDISAGLTCTPGARRPSPQSIRWPGETRSPRGWGQAARRPQVPGASAGSASAPALGVESWGRAPKSGKSPGRASRWGPRLEERAHVQAAGPRVGEQRPRLRARRGPAAHPPRVSGPLPSAAAAFLAVLGRTQRMGSLGSQTRGRCRLGTGWDGQVGSNAANAAAPQDIRLPPSSPHIYWALTKCQVALGAGDTRQTQLASRLRVETHK